MTTYTALDALEELVKTVAIIIVTVHLASKDIEIECFVVSTYECLLVQNTCICIQVQ